MNKAKLVRDKIPAIIEADGQKPVYHRAEAAEYRQKLIEKLEEEVAEYLVDNSVEELVDIEEVILALAALAEVTPEELAAKREIKRTARGGFANQIILEAIE